MRSQNSVDASSELLSELKALIASGAKISEADERRIRNVSEAARDAYEQMTAIASNPFTDPAHPFSASAIQYYKAKYLRHKRCLLAYVSWRLKQIVAAWWRSEDNQMEIHSSEVEYLQEFDDALVDYMASFPIPLDLRSFTWRPPTVTQLEVRGLRNHAFVSPISGETISIRVGMQVLLSFEEAESLIKQRVVELIDS